MSRLWAEIAAAVAAAVLDNLSREKGGVERKKKREIEKGGDRELSCARVEVASTPLFGSERTCAE